VAVHECLPACVASLELVSLHSTTRVYCSGQHVSTTQCPHVSSLSGQLPTRCRPVISHVPDPSHHPHTCSWIRRIETDGRRSRQERGEARCGAQVRSCRGSFFFSFFLFFFFSFFLFFFFQVLLTSREFLLTFRCVNDEAFDVS
jgi:hypothetical protein